MNCTSITSEIFTLLGIGATVGAYFALVAYAFIKMDTVE